MQPDHDRDQDFFECTQSIDNPTTSNVVSCNSLNQLLPPQQLQPPTQQPSSPPLSTPPTLPQLQSLLSTIHTQLQDNQFMNSIRLINTHFSHISSPTIPYKLKLCFYLNLACAYQGVWNLQMCDSTCQATEIEIKGVIEGVESGEERIKLELVLVILRMQHCAIYSQMGAHEKALATAMENLKGLKECLSNILTLSEAEQRTQQINQYGTVSFRSRTKRYLSLLRCLIFDISTNPTIQNYSKRPMFYNWKNNPQANQKLIRHSFASHHILTKDQQSRSILGLQQDDNSWISEFNIGSIMHMSSFSYEDICVIPLIYEETQKKKLYEKVIYASVLNFTIATQMRFIDSQNSESTIASLKLKSDSTYRSKMSQLSELHHLKAIQLMCKGISSKSPYLNHLINSYYKHYMQALICINEEDSMAQDVRSRVQSRDRVNEIEKNQEDYYRMESEGEKMVGSVLGESGIEVGRMTKTPNMKKMRGGDEKGKRRGSSRSLEMKRGKSRQSSVKSGRNKMEFRSPKQKGFKEKKKIAKEPLKINMIKKVMDGKNCELRMTTKSETEIKLIMKEKKK